MKFHHQMMNVSNPQRIATNREGKLNTIQEPIVSNPQRIATNSSPPPVFSPSSVSFKPSKDRYKPFSLLLPLLLRLCFKPSKDRYKQFHVLYLRKFDSRFQTLKGSLQTPGFHLDRELARLFQTLKGSLQTQLSRQKCRQSIAWFQTLKGSLQTLIEQTIYLFPSSFKPSKDRYKHDVNALAREKAKEVSNPQRIATNQLEIPSSPYNLPPTFQTLKGSLQTLLHRRAVVLYI